MAHLVSLASGDRRFSVDDGETVLAAGLRQGLTLPYGCQSGSCGSCRARCLEGSVAYPPAHRPAPTALSAAEIEAGYILLCLAQATRDLRIDLHQPPQLEQLRPRQLPVRVIEQKPLAHDVIGLQLKLPSAGEAANLRWLAGQYLDVLLADGRRRSFSIANPWSPGAAIELQVRVTPGGRFARYLQQEMPPRAILRVEAPLGAFYLREDDSRPRLMMAGGTGFAPIKAMIEQELAQGGLKQPLHLFRGTRARRDLYLEELVQDWLRRDAHLRYTPVLSEADADWRGETGWVHEALLRQYPQLQGYAVYLSGPPSMVQAGKRTFAAAGLDADHLFYDAFEYAHETWPALG